MEVDGGQDVEDADRQRLRGNMGKECFKKGAVRGRDNRAESGYIFSRTMQSGLKWDSVILAS